MPSPIPDHLSLIRDTARLPLRCVLTEREEEVARLWVAGHKIERIAAVLKIAPSSISVHLHKMRMRLRVQDRNDVALADELRRILRLEPPTTT